VGTDEVVDGVARLQPYRAHNQLSQSEVNKASGQTYRRRRPLSAREESRIEVAELYRIPDASAYGDIDWDGTVAFVVGLIAISFPRCKGQCQPVSSAVRM
jgi:hypothetical protein